MPDWLIKLWSSITSKKTAFIALLTCLLFVFFSKVGIEFVKNKEVSEAYSTFVVIVIFYSSSHLLIEFLAFTWSSLSKGVVKICSLYRKTKQRKFFLLNLELAIPQLPIEQLEILSELSNGEECYNLRQNRVFYLHSQKYIKKLHQVSAVEFVFQIDPVVKSVLDQYMKKVRQAKLERFIINIDEKQFQFLSLFFCEIIPFGTEESGNYMEHSVYSSTYELCKNNIITPLLFDNKSNNAIRYELTEDIGKILSKDIIKKPILRTIIELDKNFIYAINSYGGNAS